MVDNYDRNWMKGRSGRDWIGWWEVYTAEDMQAGIRGGDHIRFVYGSRPGTLGGWEACRAVSESDIWNQLELWEKQAAAARQAIREVTAQRLMETQHDNKP